jgi:hypothetical protein
MSVNKTTILLCAFVGRQEDNITMNLREIGWGRGEGWRGHRLNQSGSG